MSKKYKQSFEVEVSRDDSDRSCLVLRRIASLAKRVASGPVLFSEARIPLSRVRNNGHFEYQANPDEIIGAVELTGYEWEAIGQVMSKKDVQKYISREVHGNRRAGRNAEDSEPLSLEIEIESTNKFFAVNIDYRKPRTAKDPGRSWSSSASRRGRI